MKIKKVLVATLAMALTVSPLNVNFEKEVKAESISDWLDFRWDFESAIGLDNSAYVNYLRQFDKNVAYNKNTTRPYIGIVYTYNNYNYFAPLASPKPKHININPKLYFW